MAPKSVSGAAANSQNKNQLRDAVRAEIFHQLDGLALAPLIKALWDEKAFSVFQETSLGYAGLGSVRGKNQRGNRGYIHVAMRALSAYGWFVEKRSGRGKLVSYTLTPEGRAALRLLPEYDKDLGKMVAFIPKAIEMKQLLFKPGPADAGLRKRVELLRDYTGKGRPQDPVERKVDQKLRDQLTGLVLGPVMTALARKFFIAEEAGSPLKYSDPADKSKERKQAKIKKSVFDFFDAQGRLSDLGKIPGNLENLKLAFDLLQVEGWAVREGNAVELTPRGRAAAGLAATYMVTVSYLPTFCVAPELLFGDPAKIPKKDAQGKELLVDRPMNVDGSGGAHKAYFEKIDEILIQIFNNPDLDAQPKGICDMGCGNGAFLKHIYEVVKTRTLRGHHLDTHPLKLVGADYYKESRDATLETLSDAEIKNEDGSIAKIPAEDIYVIDGNIIDPDKLARDLRETCRLDVKELLHVRSFLDHNRPYVSPSQMHPDEKFFCEPSGVFVRDGEEIPQEDLDRNLVEHFRRWAPCVGRFGLILLELGTIPPELTAQNLGKTLAIPYDVTHGLSDQYLLETDVTLERARHGGLFPHPRFGVIRIPSPKQGKPDLSTILITVLVDKATADAQHSPEPAAAVDESI